MKKSRNKTDESEGWFFFNGGPGAPRYGDDPTKHAVDHDAESFVREVIQNANDQRLANDDPVEIRFRFFSLSGPDREEFLDALGWETGLRERLRVIAEHDSGRGYDRFINRIENSDEDLRLLVVEDANTTGLTGDWSDDSNYAALVRDELYSSKQDDTAGGSYGLGKSVLWTFSGASTVLFNSNPVSVGESKTPPRFIGRTKLPTHEIDGVTYQGAGWLCNLQNTDDGPRPASLWGEEAEVLAERLHLNRPTTSGTSAMVVGFRDPTQDTRPELDELADQFVTAAVKYFWPAIYRGDLKVAVETPDETYEADVNDVSAIRPFVECFANRYDDTDGLDQPGDVAGLDIPLEVPPRADGTETPDGHVRLAARLASPADDDTYQNHVALFRGAGMVVKYYDQRRIAFGDRNFHAILAGGEAHSESGTTEADQEVDRFLRFAEPPEHDDWESTENLREQYQRGFRTALDNMFDTLRDGLRHLIAQSESSGNPLSKKVLGRFPIHDERVRRRSVANPSPAFDIESSSGFREEQWEFSGNIEVLEEEFEGWSAEISMQGVGEDGATFEEIPIEEISTSSLDTSVNYENGTARIVAGEGVTKLEFEGVSSPVVQGDDDLVVGETQLEIRAEIRTSEGE
jgi:hypothetical protein